jgi:hypothetical protein
MIFDKKINSNEWRWLIGLLIIITGYSILNQRLVPILLNYFPWDGIILGLILIFGGLWLFKIQ